jgi:hypothetical protein
LLNDEQFEDAVSNGAISVKLTRQQAKELPSRPKHHSRKPSPDPETHPIELYCLFSDAALSAEQRQEINENMIAMAEDFELEARNFTGETILAEVKKLLTSKPGSAIKNTKH